MAFIPGPSISIDHAQQTAGKAGLAQVATREEKSNEKEKKRRRLLSDLQQLGPIGKVYLFVDGEEELAEEDSQHTITVIDDLLNYSITQSVTQSVRQVRLTCQQLYDQSGA